MRKTHGAITDQKYKRMHSHDETIFSQTAELLYSKSEKSVMGLSQLEKKTKNGIQAVEVKRCLVLSQCHHQIERSKDEHQMK